VDIVINNAGILKLVPFEEMLEKEWDLMMDVHLKGAFSVTRAAWNIMREKGYGRIVNISSETALYGSISGLVHYTTAKMGIHGFS